MTLIAEFGWHMHELPLFDSLQHPFPVPEWLDARFAHRQQLDGILAERIDAGVRQSLAVGMGPRLGGYDERTYAEWVRRSIPGAEPVAWCCPAELKGRSLNSEMQRLRSLGYVGIKLHPRLADFCYDDPCLPDLIKAAADHGLVSLICTYPAAVRPDAHRMSFESLCGLLARIDQSPLILLHGGLTRVLELSELLRSCSNVLLDLSFTMLRYAGSSLDLDLRFLMQTFDRRLCVGSDHPQYTLDEFRRRFDALSQGLELSKRQNIAFGNLQRLFGGVH